MPTTTAADVKHLLLGFNLAGARAGDGFASALETVRAALGLASARLVGLPLSRAPSPDAQEAPGSGAEVRRFPCGAGGEPEIFLEASASPSAWNESKKAALELVADRVGLLLRLALQEELNETSALEFNALAAVSREMAWGSDLDALLALVLHEAVKISHADGGSLYLRTPGDEGLTLQSSLGASRETAREQIPLGYGIVGWVAKNATSLRADDLGGSSTHPGGRKNHLAAPLVDEGEVLGVLALESAGRKPFTETHERILTVFAAQASKAIAVARLIRDLRSERDLRESIIDGSPNAVVALDHQRRVVLMNLAAQRILAPNDPPGDAQGNQVERYLPQPEFHEALTRVLTDASELESLDIAEGVEGERRHFQIKIYSLRRGENRGATLILQDITAQKNLDENVQRMGRMASIGQLAAGVAHEIRNPLTGIGITLEILREETGLTETGREMITDISREIDRLEALIRGLLDFARPQPAQRRPMRLAKALEWQRTFVEQCRKKGVECVVDMAENPKIKGDPERLKQMFLNFAINALDATEAGGTVTMRTARFEGGFACVEVCDTGRGMDADTQARIFDPFFTTKNEGTGLGLSIAHSIAEQHGGRIDVLSAPGRGTRFRVLLPLYEA